MSFWRTFRISCMTLKQRLYYDDGEQLNKKSKNEKGNDTKLEYLRTLSFHKNLTPYGI